MIWIKVLATLSAIIVLIAMVVNGIHDDYYDSIPTQRTHKHFFIGLQLGIGNLIICCIAIWN